eukprot:scpid46506/ scgid4549/ 
MDDGFDLGVIMSTSIGTTSMENIVIHRRILLQDTMSIQELPKTAPRSHLLPPCKPAPLASRLFKPKCWTSTKDSKPQLMRIQLIRLKSTANPVRESELPPIVESSKEISCRVLEAEEMGCNLLALHLTPIGQARKRIAFGADGSTDVIIEEMSAEPQSSTPSRLVVETSDRIFRLSPDDNVGILSRWMEIISREMGGSVCGRKRGTIAMATRSTSSCSPRNGHFPAAVAFSEKTNKITLGQQLYRPRADAISDYHDPQHNYSPPAAASKQPTQESEGYYEEHLGQGHVPRRDLQSEFVRTTRHVPPPRRAHTQPLDRSRFVTDYRPLQHTPYSSTLPPTLNTMRMSSAATTSDRHSIMSTASSSAPPGVVPHGLHERTLYGLAKAVQLNPQLLCEDDREFRLWGIAVELGIDESRFKRDVVNQRISGHLALHRTLSLAKEKLLATGSTECSAHLLHALDYAGLLDLAQVYKDLLKQEPMEPGFHYSVSGCLASADPCSTTANTHADSRAALATPSPGGKPLTPPQPPHQHQPQQQQHHSHEQQQEQQQLQQQAPRQQQQPVPRVRRKQTEPR